MSETRQKLFEKVKNLGKRPAKEFCLMWSRYCSELRRRDVANVQHGGRASRSDVRGGV